MPPVTRRTKRSREEDRTEAESGRRPEAPGASAGEQAGAPAGAAVPRAQEAPEKAPEEAPEEAPGEAPAAAPAAAPVVRASGPSGAAGVSFAPEHSLGLILFCCEAAVRGEPTGAVVFAHYFPGIVQGLMRLVLMVAGFDTDWFEPDNVSRYSEYKRSWDRLGSVEDTFRGARTFDSLSCILDLAGLRPGRRIQDTVVPAHLLVPYFLSGVPAEVTTANERVAAGGAVGALVAGGVARLFIAALASQDAGSIDTTSLVGCMRRLPRFNDFPMGVDGEVRSCGARAFVMNSGLFQVLEEAGAVYRNSRTPDGARIAILIYHGVLSPLLEGTPRPELGLGVVRTHQGEDPIHAAACVAETLEELSAMDRITVELMMVTWGRVQPRSLLAQLWEVLSRESIVFESDDSLVPATRGMTVAQLFRYYTDVCNQQRLSRRLQDAVTGAAAAAAA